MRLASFVFALMISAWPCAAAAKGKPVAHATEADEAAAREAFIAAKKHYDEKNLQQAYDGFHASYGIVASPNSHLMMAQVLSDLGRPVDAFEHMQATVWEAEQASQLGPKYAKKYERTLARAKELVEQLRTKVGIVTLELRGAAALPPGSVLMVSGRTVTDATAAVVVKPGLVDVTLRTLEGMTEQTIQVEPGGAATVAVEVPQPPPPPAPVPTPDPVGSSGVGPFFISGWVAAGVGVLGFAAFGVFGALTSSRFDDLEQACPNDMCNPELQGDIDDGQTFQAVANVGLAVGIVGAVATATFFILDVTVSEESAVVVFTEDGVAVGGRF